MGRYFGCFQDFTKKTKALLVLGLAFDFRGAFWAWGPLVQAAGAHSLLEGHLTSPQSHQTRTGEFRRTLNADR